MQFHKGRLFDHVHLCVQDLEASKRFYIAVLEAIGKNIEIVEGSGFFFADELFVSKGESSASRVHLAFQANEHEVVRRFYQAALQAGGRDNGAPGERAYHPGYFAAYVLDPDGNNIEAVFHGPVQRSAESIVLSPVWGGT